MNSKLKIFFSFVLLSVILFAAIPKVYLHSLLGHTHNAKYSPVPDVTVSESQETKDCSFEKFDTPVYYTVFKFILNFLPLRESKEAYLFYHEKTLQQLQYNTSLLRGPPTA